MQTAAWGWPTAIYLSPPSAHEVGVLGSAVHRGYDHELEAESLAPIESSSTRVKAWAEVSGKKVTTFHGDAYADFVFDARSAPSHRARPPRRSHTRR